MRFLAFHKIDESQLTPPTPEQMAAMGALIEEMTEAGVLVATGGLLPSGNGVRIRYEGGVRTVTDGPFAESKEVVGGYAILETPSLEEAMGWSTKFARLVGDTEIEIRQMYTGPEEECVDDVAAGEPRQRISI